MAAVNRVMLLGRVVAGPRGEGNVEEGRALFSVSTEGAGQDSAGQRHSVLVAGAQAAWCLARLRRGMLVHVEGELLACEREGDFRTVVAAWRVQVVEPERRSGVAGHPAGVAVMAVDPWSRFPGFPGGGARSDGGVRRGLRPAGPPEACGERTGNDAARWPCTPWCDDAGTGTGAEAPCPLSRRVH